MHHSPTPIASRADTLTVQTSVGDLRRTSVAARCPIVTLINPPTVSARYGTDRYPTTAIEHVTSEPFDRNVSGSIGRKSRVVALSPVMPTSTWVSPD